MTLQQFIESIRRERGATVADRFAALVTERRAADTPSVWPEILRACEIEACEPEIAIYSELSQHPCEAEIYMPNRREIPANFADKIKSL